MVVFSALTLMVGWQEGHPACVVAGFTNPFPDTPVFLLVPLCVCLATCVYACIAACLCVRAALMVARCASPTVLHLCSCFAPSLSTQVRKTMNDCYFAG